MDRQDARGKGKNNLPLCGGGGARKGSFSKGCEERVPVWIPKESFSHLLLAASSSEGAPGGKHGLSESMANVEAVPTTSEAFAQLGGAIGIFRAGGERGNAWPRAVDD